MYFLNKYICDYFYDISNIKWWHLNHSIKTVSIVLAIRYSFKNTFFEKLILAMMFNDAYVLLFKDEATYTIKDLWFILLFITTQYLNDIIKWATEDTEESSKELPKQ